MTRPARIVATLAFLAALALVGPGPAAAVGEDVDDVVDDVTSAVPSVSLPIGLAVDPNPVGLSPKPGENRGQPPPAEGYPEEEARPAKPPANKCNGCVPPQEYVDRLREEYKVLKEAYMTSGGSFDEAADSGQDGTPPLDKPLVEAPGFPMWSLLVAALAAIAFVRRRGT